MIAMMMVSAVTAAMIGKKIKRGRKIKETVVDHDLPQDVRNLKEEGEMKGEIKMILERRRRVGVDQDLVLGLRDAAAITVTIVETAVILTTTVENVLIVVEVEAQRIVIKGRRGSLVEEKKVESGPGKEKEVLLEEMLKILEE
jgi:hypothetical protein